MEGLVQPAPAATGEYGIFTTSEFESFFAVADAQVQPSSMGMTQGQCGQPVQGYGQMPLMGSQMGQQQPVGAVAQGAGFDDRKKGTGRKLVMLGHSGPMHTAVHGAGGFQMEADATQALQPGMGDLASAAEAAKIMLASGDILAGQVKEVGHTGKLTMIGDQGQSCTPLGKTATWSRGADSAGAAAAAASVQQSLQMIGPKGNVCTGKQKIPQDQDLALAARLISKDCDWRSVKTYLRSSQSPAELRNAFDRLLQAAHERNERGPIAKRQRTTQPSAAAAAAAEPPTAAATAQTAPASSDGASAPPAADNGSSSAKGSKAVVALQQPNLSSLRSGSTTTIYSALLAAPPPIPEEEKSKAESAADLEFSTPTASLHSLIMRPAQQSKSSAAGPSAPSASTASTSTASTTNTTERSAPKRSLREMCGVVPSLSTLTTTAPSTDTTVSAAPTAPPPTQTVQRPHVSFVRTSC